MADKNLRSQRKIRAEIEGSEPLITWSNLNLEEDDKNVPAELSTLIVTGVDGVDLPNDHKDIGDGIVHDEAWDETA